MNAMESGLKNIRDYDYTTAKVRTARVIRGTILYGAMWLLGFVIISFDIFWFFKGYRDLHTYAILFLGSLIVVLSPFCYYSDFLRGYVSND